MSKQLNKDIDKVLIASAGTLPQGEKDKFFNEVLDIRRGEMLALFHKYASEREKEARIDELKNVLHAYARTYKQTVTDSSGAEYVNDSHRYISNYEVQERLARLTEGAEQWERLNK